MTKRTRWHRFSQWYPHEQKPVMAGVYQRQLYKSKVAYAYWDGTAWYLKARSPDEAVFLYKHRRISHNQFRNWRGLDRPYKGKQSVAN